MVEKEAGPQDVGPVGLVGSQDFILREIGSQESRGAACSDTHLYTPFWLLERNGSRRSTNKGRRKVADSLLMETWVVSFLSPLPNNFAQNFLSLYRNS